MTNKIRSDSIEILNKIADGGMGEVFKGRAIGVDGNEIQVALKRIVSGELDELKNELQVLGSLDHKNICKLYGLFEKDAHHYLVMEFIDGLLLSSVMSAACMTGQFFSQVFLKEFARQMIEALQYIHSSDNKPAIVHRDISPSNIIIDKNGTVKILDFGIGREFDQANDHLTTKNFIGKLPYIAFETFAKGHYSPESDLYALGVILFELASNTKLFVGKSFSEVFQLKEGYELPNLEIYRDNLDKGFCNIVRELTAKSESSRIRAVKNYLQGEAYKVTIYEEAVQIFQKSKSGQFTEKISTVEMVERKKFKKRISKLVLALVSLGILLVTFFLSQFIIAKFRKVVSVQISDPQANSIEISVRETELKRYSLSYPGDKLSCDLSCFGYYTDAIGPSYRKSDKVLFMNQTASQYLKGILNVELDVGADFIKHAKMCSKSVLCDKAAEAYQDFIEEIKTKVKLPNYSRAQMNIDFSDAKADKWIQSILKYMNESDAATALKLQRAVLKNENWIENYKQPVQLDLAQVNDLTSWTEEDCRRAGEISYIKNGKLIYFPEFRAIRNRHYKVLFFAPLDLNKSGKNILIEINDEGAKLKLSGKIEKKKVAYCYFEVLPAGVGMYSYRPEQSHAE